jgi:acyl-CoA synthetase (AMP-forming)/AMP-acid ligase II
MPKSQSITAQLMAKDAPFEVVEAQVGESVLRVFKNAPQNMSQVYERSRAFGAGEFLVAGDRRISFDQFFANADQLAGWLINTADIKPGQSVALCMKNSPEWMIAFVSIQNAGGVAVLINSRGTAEAMSSAVEDADSVFVIADPDRLKLLREGGRSLPAITTGPEETDAVSFADAKAEPTDFPGLQADADDLAAMMFTSGTTGRAKAAALSHRNLVTGTMNTQMAMAAIFQGLARQYNVSVEQLQKQMPQACSILAFPLFHTSGCSAIFLTALANGGKLVLMDRWSGEEALRLIEQEKVTSFGGVPTMHWDVLRSENFEKYDLSSLMAVSCGGQALPLGLVTEIREKLPNVFIGAGYGMTETSGAISQANGEAFLVNMEASGHILPMMDVRISDENGEEVATGETGEIWVKGATLMQGYYGRPEETKASMSGDWFKTGDVGRLDDKGYIYIVDRKTDMVISGGENIYCAEVELKIGKHPEIIEIVSFGVPDDRLGERLVACAVVKDSAVSADDILNYAGQNLASYQVPTDIVLQTDPFEHNAMGKVEKNQLRTAYLAGLEQKERVHAHS